jgi:hypothetical protein
MMLVIRIVNAVGFCAVVIVDVVVIMMVNVIMDMYYAMLMIIFVRVVAQVGSVFQVVKQHLVNYEEF